MPQIGSMPKTNGSNRDSPTVPPKPGITPTTNPSITPSIKNIIDGPETIVTSAEKRASSIKIFYKKKGGIAPFFLTKGKIIT